MKIKKSAVFAAGVALMVVPGTIFAHHGTAAYDITQETTVKGTVTDFQFMNPHTLILVDVKNDKGVVEHWHSTSKKRQ